METIQLGGTDIVVSRLAYGCMRISGTWNPAELTAEKVAAGKAALRSAYDAGYTLFDHADIYGRGTCEEIHGELFAESPGLRERTIVATKCGIRFPDDPPGAPHRYDFRADWIIESCENSLRRLQTDYIDLYQLHRPDYLMNPHEIAEAFDQLHESGKVRAFGVSNFLPDKFTALQAWVRHPLLVNQVEISLWHLDTLEDGTLNQCLEHGITPLSWSPLGGGREGLAELEVGDLDLTPAQAALAWLMEHPAGIIPIVGTTNPARIQELAATPTKIGRENWYRMFVAARGKALA
ncbi:MAG: aldo/keto reductase [Chthonomonas sp.]|nr:aldo/keto reductase [Chthonomonas sp.]